MSLKINTKTYDYIYLEISSPFAFKSSISFISSVSTNWFTFEITCSSSISFFSMLSTNLIPGSSSWEGLDWIIGWGFGSLGYFDSYESFSGVSFSGSGFSSIIWFFIRINFTSFSLLKPILIAKESYIWDDLGSYPPNFFSKLWISSCRRFWINLSHSAK